MCCTVSGCQQRPCSDGNSRRLHMAGEQVMQGGHALCNASGHSPKPMKFSRVRLAARGSSSQSWSAAPGGPDVTGVFSTMYMFSCVQAQGAGRLPVMLVFSRLKFCRRVQFVK